MWNNSCLDASRFDRRHRWKSIRPCCSLFVQDSNIRLVTLSLSINLLKKLVYNEEEKLSYLSDHHLAQIEQSLEQVAEDLRRYYRVCRISIVRNRFRTCRVQFSESRNVSRHVRRWISSNTNQSDSSRIFVKRSLYALRTDDNTIEWSWIRQAFAIGRHRTNSKSNEKSNEKHEIRTYLFLFSKRRFEFSFYFVLCLWIYVRRVKSICLWLNPTLYWKRTIKSIWVKEKQSEIEKLFFKFVICLFLDNSDLIACTVHLKDKFVAIVNTLNRFSLSTNSCWIFHFQGKIDVFWWPIGCNSF